VRARSPAVVDDILGCATSSHCSPIVSRSSSGIAGADDNVPAVGVSSEVPGFSLASAFASAALPHQGFKRSWLIAAQQALRRHTGAKDRSNKIVNI
jgi:hypothetical protein